MKKIGLLVVDRTQPGLMLLSGPDDLFISANVDELISRLYLEEISSLQLIKNILYFDKGRP